MCSVLLLVAAVTMAVEAGHVAPASAATGHTAAPPCQQGYTCVSIPCATAPCPTVEAGPTSNLGASGGSQYVFVDLYDFPPGDAPVGVVLRRHHGAGQGPTIVLDGTGATAAAADHE